VVNYPFSSRISTSPVQPAPHRHWRVHGETCSTFGVSLAVTEQQRAIRDAVRQWAAASPPLVSRESWQSLAKLGLLELAAGETEGDVVDLAVALEQTAIALAPGPILPTVLAGLVLRGVRETLPESRILSDLAAGRLQIAIALGQGSLTGTPDGAGGLRVSGHHGPILCAGETSHLLLPAATPQGPAWFLVAPGAPGVRVTAREPMDLSRSIGDVDLDNVPSTAIAGLDTDRIGNAAATLFAAEAAGIARWCADTAAEYARTRRQFGRRIGAFQAVKHLCATMLCRAERASATAWDAARSCGEHPCAEHALSAAAAAAIGLDAAVDNAKDCIQVLGGIGFTWDHDAHRYLRRAVALRQLLGGTAVWRRRAADLALAGVRRQLTVDVTPDTAADVAADRDAIRDTISRIAGLPVGQQRAALADSGLLTPRWAAPYGVDAGVAEELVIAAELARAGVTRPDLAVAGWAAPTIYEHGTDEQRKRFLGPSLRGEIAWCQLFSEPEAGSDLAGLRTRAEPAQGGWLLTGQKVWTSLAREADWAICLARTDPAAPKHRGLTYFLVSMDSPDIEIRPLREITGRAVFNEVFLDGVFVPDDCVVGAPGDGWRLARTTLSGERIAMGLGSAWDESVERLLRLPTVPREELGALIAESLAVRLLDLRATLRRLDGSGPAQPDDSAVRKLIGVAHRQAVAEAGLLYCGPDAAAADGDAAEPVYQFLLTRCLSIAGGTTQILLTLVGERLLGLPREPAG
jgi:alkylation response protein AidB-like acyl-CoA dehydrogenase